MTSEKKIGMVPEVPLIRFKETTGQNTPDSSLNQGFINGDSAWLAFLIRCLDSSRTAGQRNACIAALNCGMLRLVLRQEYEKVHVISLRCKRKWCKFCSREWSKKAWKALSEKAIHIRPKDLRHLVLTFRSPTPAKLPAVITAAWRALSLWRRYGVRKSRGNFLETVKGMCVKIEIAPGNIVGKCHPHFHILLHCPGGIDWRKDSTPRREWESAVRFYMNDDAPISWIRACDDSRSAERELMKYCTKPLMEGVSSPAIFCQVIAALHGRRMLFSSGTLKFTIRDDSDGDYERIGTLENVLARAHESESILSRAFFVWVLSRLIQVRLEPEIKRRCAEFLALPFSLDGADYLKMHGGKPPCSF